MHLKIGRPPLFRISGQLMPTEFSQLSNETMKALLGSILSPKQAIKLEETLEMDFAIQIEGVARFRVNIFFQKNMLGAVLRTIPFKIPSLDSLGLPPVLKDIAMSNQGLILVTGPTGSGKSTTLAALINHINENRQAHVITIEDPIEYIYEDKKSVINQRELGLDTKSLGEALKRSLRQDPDIILIGEMRDSETISTALTAAETGHLVFSTLHTNDARQSIDRIVDTFPSTAQKQIRVQLASALNATISQRLVPKKDQTGRVAALEIMICSPGIKKLILEGDTGSIYAAIQSSVSFYRMQTLNQGLTSLVNNDLITAEEALRTSYNPEELKLNLRGVYTGASAEMAESIEKQLGKSGDKKEEKKGTGPAGITRDYEY